MKLTVDDVRSRFVEHFDGTTGSVYASPGRINLIGEHTDYNGGFVFPGAVTQGVIAEIKPNGTRKVRAPLQAMMIFWARRSTMCAGVRAK